MTSGDDITRRIAPRRGCELVDRLFPMDGCDAIVVDVEIKAVLLQLFIVLSAIT